MNKRLHNSTLCPKSFIAFIVCFLFSITQCFSQAGTLDSSFGVGGDARILIDTTPYQSAFASVTAMQGDGKIVLAGNVGFNYNGFIVARMLSNGEPDSTFGINSIATFYDGPQQTYVDAIVIQKDDKIVLGGVINQNDFLLARYQSNGFLDSSFGLNGKVVTDVGNSDQILSLAIQPDGKIVAAGEQNPYGCVVRYNVNGTVDSTFGTNGVAFTGAFTTVSVKLLLNGDIVTVGYGGDPDSSDVGVNMCFVVHKFLSNGKTDLSFGKHGDTYIYFYNQLASQPMDMAVNGNYIIAVGSAVDNNNIITSAIAKIKSDGALDSSYGINGKVLNNLNGYGNNINSILVQSDGKLVITSRQSEGVVIGRFMQNGIVDSSFGTNGFRVLSFIPQSFYGFFPPNGCTALQTDGKIVVVGDKDYGYFNAERLKGDATTVTIQKNLSSLEGNSGTTPVTFKIILNETSAKRVTVNYTTVDETAKAGQDYVATSGTLIFKPGQTIKRVTVNVIGDNVVERNEKFSLQLSNPNNAILGTLSTATCTIKNDDPSFAIASSNEDDAIINSIKLYPNPAKDVLHIEGLSRNANTTISVINVQGKVIMKTTVSNITSSINVKQLLPGTYFVKIESGDKKTTLKFVKE
jgi:uncharacterized delta-60 repeat protein